MQQIYSIDLGAWQIYAYNALCILGLLWMLWRYRGKTVPVLVTLLFFAGVVEDLGGGSGRNIFRIFMLVVCMWQAMKGALGCFHSKYPKTFYAFVLWATYFLADSIFVNHDSYVLAFSLLAKTLIPFLILTLMIKKQDEDPESADGWFRMFGDLIIIQVLLSIGKMIILGGFLEGWVGGMTGMSGGGSGTSFPLLGLMWLALKNGMKFSRKDRWLALGLLLIGFATGKRAVWIMFPALFVFLSVWVYPRHTLRRVAMLIVVLPLVVYLAVRISPTFNPDNKVWGTFDLEYAVDYTVKYSSGIDEYNTTVQSGVGRLGAVAWMIDQFSGQGQDVLWGRGNEFIAYADSEDYFNEHYYGGIHSRGSITGVVNTFFTHGLVGVIAYLCVLMGLFLPRRNRFNIVLFIVVLVDYIFYNAQILGLMPMLVFALFLSYFSRINNTIDM